MKVSIQTLGSFGDVMPFISVAQAFREKGIDVCILAPRDYTETIRSFGIDASVPPSFTLAEWSREASERKTLSGPVRFFRDWKDMIAPHVADVVDRCFEAAEGADVILANTVCAPARLAAEGFGIPYIVNAHQPVISPTRAVPCAMVWKPWHGDRMNRIGYAAVRAAQFGMEMALRPHRKLRGLGRHPRSWDTRLHLGRPLPRVTTTSPPLIPCRPPDWLPNDHLLPYPSLIRRDRQDLPAPLAEFLSNGAPPIYVGLGSMEQDADPDMLRGLFRAFERAGERVILSDSLAGLLPGELATGHFATGHVPHDLLFAHCGAVLHHGGAGTVDTALRSGTPQMILPDFMDQFWHAHRLEQLGVAPPMLSRKGLGGQTIAAALKTIRNPEMKARATALARQMKPYDGANELAAFTIAETERFRRNG